MKILFVMVASVFGLCLGGCADPPLVSDEDYKAAHGPAAYSPDPTNVIPAQPDPRTGRY
jgi:hypothetical protein